MENEFGRDMKSPLAIKIFLGCLLLILVTILYSTAKLAAFAYEVEAPDPERARFMLECTYDWMLSPQECREILNGKDPVTPPPGAGC